jgi:hypothetical protein
MYWNIAIRNTELVSGMRELRSSSDCSGHPGVPTVEQLVYLRNSTKEYGEDPAQRLQDLPAFLFHQPKHHPLHGECQANESEAY